jgi:hypothetical protein
MLHQAKTLKGFPLESLDGEIGYVADIIIDDETWAVRYLVIDTQHWWPGKKVLIAPQWIGRVSWSDPKVFINLSREVIKGAPEYTDWSVITREFEIGLHAYYNRQGYWAEQSV